MISTITTNFSKIKDGQISAQNWLIWHGMTLSHKPHLFIMLLNLVSAFPASRIRVPWSGSLSMGWKGVRSRFSH